MNKLKLIAFLLMAQLGMKAQELKHCGSTHAEAKIREEHPELVPQMKDMEDYLNSLDPSKFEKTRSGSHIIPVVFHIIHNYGPENISDAQIHDAMRILNEDYQLRNADSGAVVPAFKAVKANVDWEFRLARKDPDGNCTNGIDRIHSYKTYQADDKSKLNPWNRNYYFNVWVVNTIGAQGVAGYAYKPATANALYYYDGVIILHDYIGSIGTGSAYSSRALTHEIGHCMNLDHTWGATNDPGVQCGDDGVQDTPQTKGHANCNNINDAYCNPPIIENVQNYMEYSYCSNMFTLGQKDKMNTTISVSIAQRDLLVSANAQEFTGINLPVQDCAPHADFNANRFFTCTGNAINYKNQSYGDTVSSVNWNFGTDATPQTSTSLTPSVSYSSVGWKEASLTANSNAGSNTKTKTSYIYAADPTGRNVDNIVFTLEDPNDYPNWPIFNYFNNNFNWSFYDGGNSFSGYRALRFKGYDERVFPENLTKTSGGDWDEFVTPAFNLTSLTSGNAYLTFYLAAATRSNIADFKDTLSITYSNNCGATWTSLGSAGTMTSGNLINNGSTPTEFFPSTTTNWTGKSIALPAGAISSSTFFKFRYKSGENANGAYIDDIQFTKWPTAIGNIEGSGYAFNLIPNPANDFTTLQLQTPVDANGQIVITNILGEVVYKQDVRMNAKQTQDIKIDTNSLKGKGMFIVTLTLNGKRSTKKLLVN